VRALALALALTAVAAPARADDASEARFFYEYARRAFERDDYANALDRFLLAYGAAPSPGLAYNVGVCAHLAGQPGLAFTYLNRYLRASEDDDPSRREYAERTIARLRSRLRILHVRSEPAGATIFVDTDERGPIGEAPMEVVLESGEQRLILRREGFEDTERVIAADLETEQTVTIELTPRTGILRVDVAPDDAAITVLHGTDVVREASGDGDLRLPVGTYRVRVELVGHQPDLRRVIVQEGLVQSLNVFLSPVPSRACLLLVSAGEVPADVQVDGTPVGRAPLRLSGVRPGRHTIDVVADDGRRWSRPVVLEAGEARHVTAELE